MRFVITGEWTKPGLLRLIIALFLVFVAFFWVTNALLYFDRMSLSYDSVVAHYLGRPGPWGGAAVPKSYKVLLEISHGHLFAMGILVMTMTHLILFVPASGRVKALLVLATFLSALLNEGAGWLVRFVHPSFAYFKIATFCAFQLSLGAIVLLLIWALLRDPNGRGNNGREAADGEAGLPGGR